MTRNLGCYTETIYTLLAAERTKHMGKKCKVVEEIYTHEYLWRSSSTLLKQGEKENSYHQLLPALLLSYMAFEAFINYLGFILLPELWNDEKTTFRGKGIEGKLKKIVSELTGFSWEKDRSPYQRIKQLESFRDIVAHGKVLSSEYVAEQKEDGTHFQFQHAWDRYLTISSIKQFRGAIKEFCQSLLVEARNKSDHLHLNFNAYEGSLASGQGKSING